MTEHLIEIAHSKDGSHTKSDFTQHELGATGAFLNRVVKRRMGIARHMVITARVSSPYRATILAMSVMTEQAG